MGWRDGYLYIYCLPPAGGRYAPKVINAPTAPLRGGGMGGGMDTYIYIACLRQVVATLPR